MPELFYIKYIDCDTDNGSITKTEFFIRRGEAKERASEILKEIANFGGKDFCNIYFDGTIGNIYYSGKYNLIIYLNELNNIENT